MENEAIISPMWHGNLSRTWHDVLFSLKQALAEGPSIFISEPQEKDTDSSSETDIQHGRPVPRVRATSDASLDTMVPIARTPLASSSSGVIDFAKRRATATTSPLAPLGKKDSLPARELPGLESVIADMAEVKLKDQMMKKAFIEMIDDEKFQRLRARGDTRSLEEAVHLAIKYEGTESGQGTKTPKETTVARQMGTVTPTSEKSL